MHDAARHYGLSVLGEQFTAGLLHQLACARSHHCAHRSLHITGSLPALGSHRARTSSSQDRAAGDQPWICSSGTGAATKFNVEYRVADATANPYLALGALVHAGVDGIEKWLSLPAHRCYLCCNDCCNRRGRYAALPRTLG